MKALGSTRRFMAQFSFFTGIVAFFIALLPGISRAAVTQNEIVLYVYEEPIYQADLRYDDHGSVAKALQSQIVAPLMQRYREDFSSLLMPTDYELQAAGTYLSRAYLAQLMENFLQPEPPLAKANNDSEFQAQALQLPFQAHIDAFDLSMQAQMAEALVEHWKFQRHVYDFYGGGRVAMHDFGPEAVDATVNWLKVHESRGDFEFIDESLRNQFYAEWSEELTVQKPLLEGDQTVAVDQALEVNRQQLLMPDWLAPVLPTVQKQPN